jgi:hypothetical protein
MTAGPDLNPLNAPSAGELLGADWGPGAIPGTVMGKGSVIYKAKGGRVPMAPKTRYDMLRTQLDMERESWRSHMLDLKNNFLPYRTRWLDDGGVPNRGNKKMQYIVDNTPLLSLRTMSAGLMSGMTSPSRPWFRLRPDDDDLYGNPGVAEWCEKATDAAHSVLQRSNFYRQMPSAYSEIGGFGTAALGVYEIPYDPKKTHQKLINVQTYTIGEYWISQDDESKVDTFIRKFKWTVRQIVMKFVADPTDPEDPASQPTAEEISVPRDGHRRQLLRT